MAEIDTILFDFDGTVMDTDDVIIQSWQHTFKTLENREEEVSRIIRTFGEPLALTMEKTFPAVPVEEALQIYRRYHFQNFGKLIRLFPDMRELLQELTDRNYKIGLVTSRLRGTTMEGLEKYQIADYFGAVITADDTDKHKPDPTPVQIALSALGSLPERTLMLGDTMFDILCAKNAGVRSALVGWAVAVTEEDLQGPDRPDYIINQAMELLDVL